MPRIDDLQPEVASDHEQLSVELPNEQAVTLHLVSAEVGHELAHTSNFLRYLTDCLDAPFESDSTRVELLGYAQRELERIQTLLHHLRKLRTPNPELFPTELGFIFESVAARLKAEIPATLIDIQFEAPTDLRVLTNPGFLIAALHHLLSHAVHHCPADGRIAVRICLHDDLAKERVQIDIVDAGPPLAAETSAALFDPWNIAFNDQQARRRALAFRMF